MFVPISRKLFRWGTPDPQSDWMMFGHLLVRHEGCILFDPPLVPALLESASRLGRIEAVVLTTLDHSRAAAHIVRKTGAKLYLPDQQASDVDPMSLRIQQEVPEHIRYMEGRLLDLQAFRLKVSGNRDIGMPSMNEFAFLTGNKELVVGDFVSASAEGLVLVAPEWFPSDKPLVPYEEGRIKFKELVRKTGALSLLPSHGHMLLKNLQEAANRL